MEQGRPTREKDVMRRALDVREECDYEGDVRNQERKNTATSGSRGRRGDQRTAYMKDKRERENSYGRGRIEGTTCRD